MFLFIQIFSLVYFKNLSPCYVKVFDMDELDCLIEKSCNFFREGKLYSSIVPYFCFQLMHSYRDHPISRRNIRTQSGTRRGFF